MGRKPKTEKVSLETVKEWCIGALEGAAELDCRDEDCKSKTGKGVYCWRHAGIHEAFRKMMLNS